MAASRRDQELLDAIGRFNQPEAEKAGREQGFGFFLALDVQIDLFASGQQGQALNPGLGHDAEQGDRPSRSEMPFPIHGGGKPEDRSPAVAGKHVAIDEKDL